MGRPNDLILGQWLAELVGWIEPTMVFGRRTPTLFAAVDGELDTVDVVIGLAFYVMFVIAFTALLSLKRVEEDARRRLEIQSWRLRQLVSDARAA